MSSAYVEGIVPGAIHHGGLSILLGTVLFLAGAVPGRADTARPTPLTSLRAPTPPVIDGVLDDEVWRSQPLALGEWLSYNPLHGDRVPQTTRVWVAHDDRYLYFAFDCRDPDPQRIKTSVSRRDNVWSDDWVGLSLDALGTGQVSYHMMVNPSGIQMDMLNSVSGGEDESPDWIWDSAGRRTEGGYAVEIRLPLQSIRFTRGEQVTTGILFWRRVSRLGVSVSWPALEPGTWVFQKHAPLIFERLEAPLTREVIPTTTYVFSGTREPSGGWATAAHRGEVGFSGRIGLTPALTLDATLNPDFSQVESDAFQVEVNQRFPVFFSEKRPFFMEGADIFRLAGIGNGDASMIAAVHTRRIVNPVAGAKLTGNSGRWSYGTLSASDQSPGSSEPGDPLPGDERVFNIGRARYSLGTGSFVGALATDTRLGPARNHVVGADVSWQIRPSQQFSAAALQSWSTDEGPARQGAAVQLNYGRSSRRATIATQFEHYDRDFVMETAFYNRVGFTSAWAYLDTSFYPDKDRHPWIRRIVPFTFLQGGRDRVAGGDDLLSVSGFRFHFTRQGFFRIDRFFGREPWAGQRFDIGRIRMMGRAQLLRWLQADGYFHRGRSLFYDEQAPFGGRENRFSGGLSVQPTGRLTQSLSYARVAFDRVDDGTRVYTIHVLNTRTSYQFTRELAVRAIAQYDSARHRVLTDFLSSYELRPGTVIYAGYGSLFERRTYRDDTWVVGEGPYRASQRGLFMKASYLHRF